MTPGQSIRVQLVDRTGKELNAPNICLKIRLFIRGRFRYEFSAGRTDPSGEMTITYDDLEKQRASLAQVYLMDYNDALDLCDGRVEIFAPTEQELKSRYQTAVQQHGNAPAWSEHWPSNSKIEANKTTATLINHETRITIPSALIA